MTEQLEDKQSGAVRIVTWNVAAGSAKKVPRVWGELDADVAVLCEVCTEGKLRKTAVDGFRTMDWVGRIQQRGLAVLGFGSWKTKMHDAMWDQRIEWTLPAKATGPGKVEFDIVGCWAFNKRAHFDPTDYQQAQGEQIPAAYPKLFDGPTVVAGDFNNSKIWDKPGKPRNWMNTVEVMEQHGLVSAYHRFFEEEQGEETRPTHWWKRSTESTYHIDHCFVPAHWDITQVWVGGPGDWLRKGDGSDHAPLVVDVVPK